MTRKLPPLTGLRAFEAAARWQSFKQAAEELHVTPAAVSQQVRGLEDMLGVRLFDRLTRELRLTESGERALPLLTEGFDRLADAVAAMKGGEERQTLTVSVAPTFAAKWLVPRLARFAGAHPEIELRIDADEALVSFTDDEVDAAIRYGRGSYRGLRAERLLPDVSFPVCSPRLLENGPPLREPADLANHMLIHVRWKMEQAAASNWRMWLRAAGVEGVDPSRGPRFSAESLALQAAVEGQGLVLATQALVADDLRAGRLVRPFGDALARETEFCFWLVYPEGRAETPNLATFRAWVLDEVEDGDIEREAPDAEEPRLCG